MRKTKIICTIGPKTNSYEALDKLAKHGMNVARLNMSHGDHLWHSKVIKSIKSINEKGKYSVAILLDTKGPEVRTGDLKQDVHLSPGDKFTFTIRRLPEYPADTVEVSYDGFINDVKTGDEILIDSGLIRFEVVEKTKTDIICEITTGGVLSSRRHINVAGSPSKAPTITKKDWEDIKFGINQGVDFIALSFVKDASSIKKLKNYLLKKNAHLDVIAKIENASTLGHLEEIIKISDGVMIARGDLGAEVPLEEVPLIQEEIVSMSRRLNRPVIIATHLLESMIINPAPTRAEVTDITEAVREGADAIMLSGETASGKYPVEALTVMDRVAKHIEKRLNTANNMPILPSDNLKEQIATSATIMANNITAAAILVFTRRGFMAAHLSRCRPKPPIYGFTNMSTARRKLNIYWGVSAFRIEFSQNPEKTIQRAIETLLARGLISNGNRIVVVSDILAGKEFVETIQVRKIK